MTESASQSAHAYLAHRGARNAHRRWVYALLLVGITTTYLLVHALGGELRWGDRFDRAEQYAAAFAWLLGVGLLGVATGRAARAAWFDDGWVAMLLAGMVALVHLDASIRDLSAYVLISLPVAIVYGTDVRRSILLHGGALVAAMASILHSLPLEAGMIGFLVTLSVGAATAIYVSMNVERVRREEFLTAHALGHANRELAARSGELACLNAELAARSRSLEEVNRRLEQLAMTDPLTGVANRRQLFESLEHEFARSRRYANRLAVAVIDLDDFGQVNKLHGMIAGDEVLAGFAAALRERVRGVDLIGRYGGEEFVIVMPDSSAEAAHLLLERVRDHLQQTPLGTRGLAITFSAGVAALAPEDDDPLTTLDRADGLMRRAKNAGKNRIVSS